MGILLYFLVTGAMPFKGNTVAALKHAILDGYFEVPDYISSECEELIAGILVRKPANRLSGKEVSSRCWVMTDSLNFETVPRRQKLSKFIFVVTSRRAHAILINKRM